MNTQSSYYIFYYSTWLQITIITFGKIFSREEMLADLAVFSEIRQIKFQRRNTFVTRKIKSRRKKKNFINCKIIVCSSHIETSQLICNSNQLAGFNTIRVFTERCFRTDYKFPDLFPVSFFTRYRLVHCIQKY